MGTAGIEESTEALRAEYDALATRLVVRPSIDSVRRGAYAAFTLVVTGGLSAKLAYDRWGPNRPSASRGPPVYFYLALTAAILCLAVGVDSFLRARRQMRTEDHDYARLRALRDQLGLEP